MWKKEVSLSFCETSRKSYDIVVCKVLLILKGHFKEDLQLSNTVFESSSKNYRGNWKKAIRDLSKEGFNIEYGATKTTKRAYVDYNIISVTLPS